MVLADDGSVLLEARTVVCLITRIRFVKMKMHHLMRHGHDGGRQGVVFVGCQPDDMCVSFALTVGLILAPHFNEVELDVITGRQPPTPERECAPKKIINSAEVFRG